MYISKFVQKYVNFLGKYIINIFIIVSSCKFALCGIHPNLNHTIHVNSHYNIFCHWIYINSQHICYINSLITHIIYIINNLTQNKRFHTSEDYPYQNI